MMERLVAGLLAVPLGFAACGGEGGGGEKLAAGLTKEAFCLAMVAVDAPFIEAGQYASRDQKTAAAKQILEAGLLDKVVAAAPAGIVDAAKVKADAIRSAAGGNTGPLIDNPTLDASARIDAFCGPGGG